MTNENLSVVPEVVARGSKFSLAVPYRTDQVWENWGRTARCRPEYSFYPECLDDLIQIVHFAREQGKK